MMCTPVRGTCSAVASRGPRTLAMIRVTTAIASWEVLARRYISAAPRGPRILGARAISSSCTVSSTRQLNSDLSNPVIPLAMMARS